MEMKEDIPSVEESKIESQEPSPSVQDTIYELPDAGDSINSMDPIDAVALSEKPYAGDSGDAAEAIEPIKPVDLMDSCLHADSSEESDRPGKSGSHEKSGSSARAQKKLQKMIDEIGADTLLEIIKDNRNAAIRQILAEMEKQRTPLQSGISAARGCNSIFELASQA